MQVDDGLNAAAAYYLALPLGEGAERVALLAQGVDGERATLGLALVAHITTAATGGDMRAAKLLVDLVAGRPSFGPGPEIIDDV